MRRRRVLAILATGIITALLVAPAIGSAAPAAKSTKGNTLHVEVVRFAKGTSRQHMLDVVAAAGGALIAL